MMLLRLQAFQMCFDESPVAFCVLHALDKPDKAVQDMEFTYTNSAFAELQQISAEELQTKSIAALFEKEAEGWMRLCRRAMQGEAAESADIFFQRAQRHVHLQAYCVQEEYCACVLTDITDRIVIEKRLEQGTKNYHSLLDTTPCAIAVIDCAPDGTAHLHFFNQELCSLMECSREGLEKMPSGNLCRAVEEDVPSIREQMSALACAKTQERAKPIEFDYRMRTYLGHLKSVKLRLSVQNDSCGGHRYYAAFTDMTQQIEAEKAVRFDNERLTAILEHAKLAYWEYDLKAHMLFAGPRLVREFGVPEVMGNFPYAFIEAGFLHPDSTEAFLQLHWDIENGARTSSHPIKLGEAFHEAWYLIQYTTLFDEDGTPVRALATAQSLQAYKELEEQFQITLEQNNIYTWYVDLTDRALHFSAEMQAAYGAPHLVFLEHGFDGCFARRCGIHPDDVEKFANVFQQILGGKRSVQARLRCRNNKTGQWDWMAASYDAVYDRSGALSRILASYVNINRRVEEESRYQAFQNYRRMAVKNTLASFRLNLTANWCGDGQGSGALFSALQKGTTADGLFAGINAQIADAAERQSFQAGFNRQKLIQLFKNGNPSPTVEARCRYEGKTERWLRIAAEMVENPETHDVEALLYAIDIDQQKKTRLLIDKLFEEEYEFMGLLHVQTGGITVYGEKTDQPDRPLATDQDYEQLLREMLGATTREQRDESWRMLRISSICAALERASGYTCTLSVEGTHGKERKLWKCVPVDAQKTEILITRVDVTEAFLNESRQKEQLEQALRAAQKANDAKFEFLSRMSHDMRTPMNGILGLVELAEDMEMSAELRATIKKIHGAGGFLLRLINDTLDMTKIERNHMTLNLSVEPAQEVVEQTMELVCAYARDKGVRCSLREVDICPGYVRIDKLRVQQIVLNIASNAVKFSPKGGKVDLELVCEQRDSAISFLCLTVRDYGIGMSKEFLGHLFEPFAQEKNHLDAAYSGTGLGMPIVKRLVELMEGTIEVNSSEGKGTEVKVHLPVARMPNYKPGPQAEAVRASLRGTQILLCEDHPLNREIAVRILEKAGCRVETAENGVLGVRIFTENPAHTFGAVLMDIRMPEMNGLDAARAIRASGKADAKTIPIIAMSANAFEEDKEISYAAGMNAHLAKPVEQKELYATLGRFLLQNTAGGKI